MSDEPFGRQLKPVYVTVTGGNEVDRTYWAGRLRAFLEHQPCVTNMTHAGGPDVEFMIHPDANND